MTDSPVAGKTSSRRILQSSVTALTGLLVLVLVLGACSADDRESSDAPASTTPSTADPSTHGQQVKVRNLARPEAPAIMTFRLVEGQDWHLTEGDTDQPSAATNAGRGLYRVGATARSRRGSSRSAWIATSLEHTRRTFPKAERLPDLDVNGSKVWVIQHTWEGNVFTEFGLDDDHGMAYFSIRHPIGFAEADAWNRVILTSVEWH